MEPASRARPSAETRAVRPDKREFDAKVAALNGEINGVDERLAALDAQIAEAKKLPPGSAEEQREARATMKSLREQKNALMRDRGEITKLQKSAKALLDSKITAGRSLRAELKYTAPEDIEKKIASLEKLQATRSMSLKDEKMLLNEIDQLKQSKKLVSHLAANNDSISSARKSSQSISEHLSAKEAEIALVKAKIVEQKQILDSLNEANSERRAALPLLFKGKDALRKEKQAKVETIKALRADFRAAENAFRKQHREFRKRRNELRKMERDVLARNMAAIGEDEEAGDAPSAPLGDDVLRSLALAGAARGGDEASEASAATYASRATSAHTAIPTVHGASRMAERAVQQTPERESTTTSSRRSHPFMARRLRELQKAKKHGTKTRQHTGRWKIEYQGVVYITDQRQKKVITTYKTNQADSSSDSSSSVPRGYELDLGQLLRDKL